MQNPKMLLIVNPVAGVNDKKSLSGILVEKLSSYGYDVDLVFTKGRGHATELAQRAANDGYGSVVACGGDGTVNETARALCGTDVAMAIIPSGSGNGLARHIDIPIDELKSLEIIAQGYIVDCDCGKVEDQPFFCTFGIGFDASVAHRFAHEHRRGRMTYIKNVFEEFLKYKPKTYRLNIDGNAIEREAFIIACCNASQYGNNAFIAPKASVTDGLLDIIVVKSGSAIRMMLAGIDVMTGLVPYNHHIEVFKARKAEIGYEGSSYAHLDGEPLTMEGDVKVECLPNQLKLYCNPSKHPFKPIITPIDLTLRDWGIAIEKIFR